MESIYQVFFSLQPLDRATLPQNSIQVYPKSNNWNDFGHRTQFLCLLPNETVAEEIRLYFLGTELEPDLYLKNKLIEHNAAYLPASKVADFFSMQYEIEDYRKWISKLGVDLGNLLLLALHDLVAGKKHAPLQPWFQNAIKTRAFNLSFMRNSPAVYAFYNGGSVLSGIAFEDLNAAPEELQLRFRLHSFLNDHSFSFKFDFNSVVPKRLCVLIGKNGVGKSQTLRKIVESAVVGDSSFVGTDGTLPKVSQIIAVCTPGETYSTFPLPPQKPRTKYIRLTALPDELSDNGGQTLPEIILQLARVWDRFIGQNSRWDIFQNAVRDLIPLEELGILKRDFSGDQSDLNSAFVPIVSLSRGGEQNTLEAMRRMDKSGKVVRLSGTTIAPLSSGQLSFLRLAAQLCLHIENGSLILIDEPETHLHPNLITDFVALLSEILERSGSIGIAATHSAYLVREVPRSQVFVIQETSNRNIEIATPRLRTFGADVGAISDFVFNDGIVNKLINEVVSRIKDDPVKHSDWQHQLKDELSPEAVMVAIQMLEEANSQL